MAEDDDTPIPESLLPYDEWTEDALRLVVLRALDHASREGMPGEHHFYITFATAHPGVIMPDRLRAQYPDEMTIVLQHQYKDLAPGETFFTVTLKFGGQPKRLSVPYAAVTRFYDPSVQFLLQFEAVEPGETEEIEDAPATLPTSRPRKAKAEPPAEPKGDGEGGDGDGDGPKVVSLDQFRKK